MYITVLFRNSIVLGYTEQRIAPVLFHFSLNLRFVYSVPWSDLKYCTLLLNGIARYLSSFMKLSYSEELGLFLRKYTTLNLELTSVNLAI